MYNIAVPDQEIGLVETIEQQWKELFQKAKTVDRSLIKVKKKFTKVASYIATVFKKSALHF